MPNFSAELWQLLCRTSPTSLQNFYSLTPRTQNQQVRSGVVECPSLAKTRWSFKRLTMQHFLGENIVDYKKKCNFAEEKLK